MSELSVSPAGAARDIKEAERGAPLAFAPEVLQNQHVAEVVALGQPSVGHDKVHQALDEVFKKLFLPKEGESAKFIYSTEAQGIATELGIDTETLVARALAELSQNTKQLLVNVHGRITNPEQVGKHFQKLFELISEHVDIHLYKSKAQLRDAEFPFSPSIARSLETIIERGEVAVITFIKKPPETAAIEIRKVADESLNGLMTLWSHPKVLENLKITPSLRDFINYATVHVHSTGTDSVALATTHKLNQLFEKEAGFEKRHSLAILKSISHDEQHESLSAALKVCIPILLAGKVLEKYFPGGMHIVGGMLDDLFGAILPNVAVSMGRKDLPKEERWAQAKPVLTAGLLSLIPAAGFGWASTALYASSSSPVVHALSGVLFAFACSAGTVGTSISALRHSYKSLCDLEKKDDAIGAVVRGMSRYEKMTIAFRDAILEVPFRVGHTLLGVPTQIALGVAAGLGGFFHNGLFVAVEGMAETGLGLATTYLYEPFNRWRHERRLKTLS